MSCKECGKLLSLVEAYYYEDRCEECEREWADDVARWRKGEEVPRIEALYGEPKRTLQ